MSEEEPKIIVDEDWKSKVQREREELASKTDGPAEAAAENSDGSPQPDDIQTPPPASLTLLVTTLLTQAMAAMGQIPSEEGKAPEVNLPFAKHFIDLAGVIEEKTKGNLTEEETSFVTESLHQVRMLFVSVKQKHKK